MGRRLTTKGTLEMREIFVCGGDYRNLHICQKIQIVHQKGELYSA